MFTSSNNYKNSIKRLRKNNSSLSNEREKRVVDNYYKYLLLLEEEEEEPECKEIVREKTSNIDFNDLPEDTIYKILTFLSANTRLAILKHKYNKNFVKSRLQKMPETNESLTKLWRCADISFHLLKSILNDDNELVSDLLSYPIRGFKKEKNPKLFSTYYKRGFTKIIMGSMRNYTRIYKFGHYTNKEVIECIEQIMLNIFAHLTMMK
jgi:hypothetical protein